MDITITFKSGGNIRLTNAFIAGNGVAGDSSTGVTLRFSDEVIDHVTVNNAS